MKSMTRAGLLGYEVRNFSLLEINERIQKLECLPKMPCTWVIEMIKVSIKAVDMDFGLKWNYFSR